MADAGMPIEQVADQLGHRDLRMLQKHYRHRLRPTVGGGRVLGEVLDLAEQLVTGPSVRWRTAGHRLESSTDILRFDVADLNRVIANAVANTDLYRNI